VNPVTHKREAEDPEAEIGQLPDLSHAELKDRWRSLFGNPAPKHISRQLMEKAIAFRMREKALGIPSAETRRRLRHIAAAIRDGREETVSLGPQIRPGTRLVRAWQGTTHIIEVETDGFVWQGAQHASLSGIAKAITGTNWNGFAFFGVKRRPSRNKNAAKDKSRQPKTTSGVANVDA